MVTCIFICNKLLYFRQNLELWLLHQQEIYSSQLALGLKTMSHSGVVLNAQQYLFIN